MNRYLKKMGIPYEGNKSGKGVRKDPKYKTAEEYAKGDNVKGYVMRDKLIRDGLREYKCEICGISEWQGVRLTLELHHKDRNHYNNDLNNL